MKSGESIRVLHPRHGAGIVQSWRRGGRVAVVSFDSQPLPLEIPANELQPSPSAASDRIMPVPVISAPPEQHSSSPTAEGTLFDKPATSTPAAIAPIPLHSAGTGMPDTQQPLESLVGSHERRHAALTLEAMRLGVVPDADLSVYTVGRDQENAIVAGDLDRVATGGGAVRAFIGDYGVGKTHLLELLQQRALAQGYLSALVMLNQEETSPSHPKRVYRALVRNVRYPDRPFEEGEGLSPLLEKAAKSSQALTRFGIVSGGPKNSLADLEAALQKGYHLYLSPAISYARSLRGLDDSERRRRTPSAAHEADASECLDLLEDWIEGHPTISNQVIDTQLARAAGKHPKIYSLLDFRPWARIYGYLLSGIAALARAVGYRGLVVLLDEAEFYSLLSRDNRAFADHLFKSWTYAAIGGSDVGAAEELPFDAADIEIGGYGIQQRLPGRYSDDSGLYIVFAMTPSPDGLAALGGAIPSDRVATLTPLAHADYMALAARICDFYASAYSEWRLPGKLVEPLGKVLSGLIQAGYVSNPRHAMKFLVEFLDVVRFQPSKVGAVVRDLQTQLV